MYGPFVSEDRFFPFSTEVTRIGSFLIGWDCSFVSLLKISYFHSEICPSVLLSKINSFLFGVWPSVLLKYQLLSFLRFTRLYFAKYQILPFWLRLRRCSSVPLRHNPIFYLSHHWAGMYTAKRGRDISGHHTYWALCCVGEKVKNRYPSD